jgi:UDP-N-acetylglucosamine 3-dehydrogenase
MTDQRYRGIVAGLGTMGTYHLRVLSSLPRVDVAGVIDPSEPRRHEATRAYPALPAFDSLEAALADVDADFACLAAPVEHLPVLARVAIEAGLDVLVEKPMAPTEEEALELIRFAEERGRLLSVGHVERFNPAVMLLKEKLEQGQAGQVHQVHARRLSPYPARQSMLGVALDLATHDLDIARYLTGSEVARVYAETDARGGPVEDLICASLRMESGATALLEVNWITPAKVRELSVTGEKGMFVVNYLTQDLYFYENPETAIEWEALGVLRGTGEGDMVRYALQRREPLRVQWEAFVAALGGAPPAVTGLDGLAALSTARAVQASGSSHEPVVPRYRELLSEAAQRVGGDIRP